MNQTRHLRTRVVVASFVILVACFGEAVDFNRWEVNSCEEMAPIIQKCYDSKDVDCIMDFIIVKGVSPELVDAQRAKLSHYVQHRTLNAVMCGPLWPSTDVPPTEGPTHWIIDRVLTRPSFTPVGMSVWFLFGEPEIRKSGYNTVTRTEHWGFWMAEGQGAIYLVMREDVPFNPDDQTFDALMLYWLEGAWEPPYDLMKYELEEFIPGQKPEWYRSSLAASFERLHREGLAVLCSTESNEFPWWESLHDCPDQPDPRLLLHADWFWEVSREQPGEEGYYWFTLTPEGEAECERLGCEETRDEIDSFLRQDIPDMDSPYAAFFD